MSRTLTIVGCCVAMIAALFVIAFAPARAQTVSGCGTATIAKASLNSAAKLTTEAACFGKARDAAAAAAGLRQTRLAQITPPPPPVVVPPVVTPAPPPAGLRVGMNLAGLDNSSTELPFIDYLKLGGDPTKGQLSVPVAAGPIDLVLLYDGSLVPGYEPAPKGNSLGWNAMQPTSFAPGRVTFHSDQGGSVNLTVAHSDPADPIRNVHLMRASDEAAFRVGRIFNPDFLAFIKSFSPLRTMDWSCTNGSPLAHWADRPKLTDAVWGCAPIEVQVALANETAADLWLNIPAHADDDYVRQAVTLVRDTLDPALRLHLEYSNEVWNGSFEQSKWSAAQAVALWGATVPPPGEAFYGYRSAQVAAIARAAFAASPDRLRPVVSSFPGWGDSQMDDAIAFGVAKANVGTISVLFDEYAVTTYFGDELGYFPGNELDRPVVLGWATGGAAGLDAAFHEIEFGGTLQTNASLAAREATYTRQAAKAKAWGLDLVAYEGGLSAFWFAAPDSEKPARTALITNMLADPRMGTLYRRMAANFAKAGGKTLVHFNDVGKVGIFGPWPVAPDLKTSTPRLEALRAASGR